MNLKKIYNEKREEMKLVTNVQVLDKAVIVTVSDSANTNFISVKNIKAANVAMAYNEAFEEAAQYFLNLEEEQEEKSNGLIDQIMPLPNSDNTKTDVLIAEEKNFETPIAEESTKYEPIPNFSMPEPMNITINSEMPVIEKSEPISPVPTCVPEISTPITITPEPANDSNTEINPVPEIQQPPIIDTYVPTEMPCNIPMPDMSVVFAPTPNVETQNDQSVISYESSNSVQQMVNSQLANVQPIVTDDQGATEIPFGPAFGSKISEMGITNAQWYVKNIPDHSKYLSYREQIRQFYGIQ